MVDLSREELDKICKMSGLSMNDKEADEFIQDLKQLIAYTDEIVKIELGIELEANKSVNVFREDKVYSQDSGDATTAFQETEDDHLVVPKVLD